MTLLEALIAVAIVCGVMASAIQTFGIAASRSVVAGMEVDAANLAESLLARAGEDLPTQGQQEIQDERGTLTWRLVSSEEAGISKKIGLLKVESYVRIVKDGIVVEQQLSTLKLKQVPAK